MNFDDMQLMKNIISQIDDMNNGNKVLFLVKYERIAKTNLILLKALLEGMKKKGVFISIDRPYSYMEHLLKMHQINYKELIFLDPISKVSVDRFKGMNKSGNVSVLDSPFQNDLLSVISSLKSKIKEAGKSDFTIMDFVLLDNVATLLNYNDKQIVEIFLEDYLDKLGAIDNIFLPLILDSYSHRPLYEVAKRLCDREIDIDGLRGKKANLYEEVNRRSLLSDKKKSLDLFSYRKCFSKGE